MEAAHTVHKRAKQHRRRRGNKRAVERKEGRSTEGGGNKRAVERKEGGGEGGGNTARKEKGEGRQSTKGLLLNQGDLRLTRVR